MSQTAPLDANAVVAEIIQQVQALPSCTTADVRAVRRTFSKRLVTASPAFVLEVARLLLEQPEFLFRFIAYELIGYHRTTLRSLGLAEVEQLGQGIDSWYSVDTFAPYIAGPAWRENQLSDEAIFTWARSPDRWWRRAALVCTVALNNQARGGKGDTPRTLAVCRLLVADRDDMVLKALSWALRELAKCDPGAVRGFLTEHEQVLAARVLREVRNKLESGLKNPRRG